MKHQDEGAPAVRVPRADAQRVVACFGRKERKAPHRPVQQVLDVDLAVSRYSSRSTADAGIGFAVGLAVHAALDAGIPVALGRGPVDFRPGIDLIGAGFALIGAVSGMLISSAADLAGITANTSSSQTHPPHSPSGVPWRRG
jgi:hypothetical protein